MGVWGGVSALANSVVTDLGAFGVLPGQASTVGGHATTQVVVNPATGVSSITTTNTSTSSYIGIGIAAILVVVGLYLLLWDHKEPHRE